MPRQTNCVGSSREEHERRVESFPDVARVVSTRQGDWYCRPEAHCVDLLGLRPLRGLRPIRFVPGAAPPPRTARQVKGSAAPGTKPQVWPWTSVFLGTAGSEADFRPAVRGSTRPLPLARRQAQWQVCPDTIGVAGACRARVGEGRRAKRGGGGHRSKPLWSSRQWARTGTLRESSFPRRGGID